jgi:AraC family transcriptional regulator
MARGYISAVDTRHRRRIDVSSGTKVVWSSARAWTGMILEKLAHSAIDTPEFVIDDHCVVLHDVPAATIEHKIHGVYRRFLHGPGNICLFSGGASRQLRSSEPHSVLVLSISPQMFGRAVGRSDVAPSFELVEHLELRDPRIEHIVRGLELEVTEGFSSGALFGDSLGLALALHLAQRYAIPGLRARPFKGGIAPKALRRVVEYVDGNLSVDLGLTSLAVVAGLSAYRFAHNFKTTTGLTPYRYVTAQKIARAKRLLSQSGMTVTEIGYALGYSQPSRFSSVFSRWTGVTPSVFRRASR